VLDRAHRHPDADLRRRDFAFAELMIPILKGWSTEVAQRTAYLGVQVHGGMGFIEESGAAQYVRDARITTIYEGTTGIQANDLIGRKIVRDKGKALSVAIAEMRAVCEPLGDAGSDHLSSIGVRLSAGVDALDAAARWIVASFDADPRAVLAGAGPFLELAGTVCGGAQLGRAALRAAKKLDSGDGDPGFLRAKIATARHFADHCLAQAPGLRDTVVAGATGVLALAEDQF
jgi:3-(methylsulfanyl)propanoyl-CoA dehydrogenase